MSDIMEKTFVSLHNLIAGSSRKGFTCSGFQSLVDVVSGVTTKSEQDFVIQKELDLIKCKLGEPGLKPHHVKEFLIRAIYCEMLGYSVPFIYIHAIKLAQHGTLADKRIGYLVSTIFLHENHELVILLINTIQKDLKSTNILEICMALTAATYLVNAEMAGAIVDLTEEKLSHPKEMVRKKAILLLHRFLLINPATVTHLIPRLKACIGDSDPEVVSAAINFIHCLAVTDKASCRDIVEPVVQVLHQVLHRKLPIDFDYHGIPGPWIQMDILRLLAVLGHGDAILSGLMYDMLKDVFQRVDINHRIGYAVLYECVCTAVHIHPNDALLEIVSSIVGKFLQSSNSDMKYMGLKALNQIVQNVHPSLASQHQSVVMSCLHHSDASIRTKTLDLLFCLTNSSNIQVMDGRGTFTSQNFGSQKTVCPKILDHLSTAEEYAKTEIILKTLGLIHRHSSDPKWSFQIMNGLILNSTSASLLHTIEAVRNLVQSGTGDLEMDRGVRILAAETYYDLLLCRDELKQCREVVLLEVTVVRDFCPLSSNVTTDSVFQLFSGLLGSYITESNILTSILMTLKKIVMRSNVEVGDLGNQLKICLKSQHPTVRQLACELNGVLKHAQSVKLITAENNITFGEIEDLGCDWTLSFLDTYICDALASGSSPYKPLAFRKKGVTADLRSLESSGRYYDVPWDVNTSSPHRGPASISSLSTHTESTTINSQHGFAIKLPLEKVKRVWHREGCDFTLNSGSESSINNIGIQLENSLHVVGVAQDLHSSSSNLNADDDLANALFGNLKDSRVVAGPTNAALDSNSSTSSIQRISSDSDPSSSLVSPLDSLSKSLVIKLDLKPQESVDPCSPPFTLVLEDECNVGKNSPSENVSSNLFTQR